MKKTLFIVLGLVSLLFFSCKDDIQNTDMNIQYDTSLGIPLGKAKFNIADILNKSDIGDEEIYADNSGRYYFMMEDSSAFALRNIQLLPKGTTVSAGESFAFSNYLSGISIPIGGLDVSLIPSDKRQFNVSREKFIAFPIQTIGSEERIDSAGIKHSELFINLEKPAGIDLKIKKFKINFPIRNDNTDTLVFIEIPNAQYSTAEFNHDYYFTIDDFMVKIEDDPSNPGTGGFKFNVEIEAELEDGTIHTTDQIKYNVTYTIFDYKVVYGAFEPDKNVAKTIAQLNFNLIRDINNGKSSGVLLFDEINVDLALKNYDIGMYITLSLDTMKGFERDHLERGYQYAQFGEGIYGKAQSFTTRPEIPFSGNPSRLNMHFTKEDGAIHNMFKKDFLPDRFELNFSILGVTNNGSTPMFITNEAAIECDVKFTIPLNLRPTSYYIYTDSIQGFSESISNGIFQYIDKAELYIGLENGLPIGAELSLILQDENGQEIVSDLTNSKWYVPKAETNAAGEVKKETVTPQNFKVMLSQNTMNDLKKAKKMLYKVKASNEDETDNICFKDDNRFNIVLSLYAEGGYKADITNK